MGTILDRKPFRGCLGMELHQWSVVEICIETGNLYAKSHTELWVPLEVLKK